MKRYISASTEYLSGSYLIDRDGDMYSTKLHAPSTTYLDRGLYHLAPTDAGFLYDIGEISEADAFTILAFCLVEYLHNIKHLEPSFKPSMLDLTEFASWAELKHSPSIQNIFNSRFKDLNGSLSESEASRFWKLDEHWYQWLRNNFVKLSIMGKIVEFRIQSTDRFDWNSVIIDDVILSYDWKPNTKFNILREDASGYKAYFFNATLDDILENDNVILASLNMMKEHNNIVASFNSRKEILTAYEKVY